MNDNQPAVAFGRYPCCDAVRPIPVSAGEQVVVQESCPACGTRVSRIFNGFLHVISVREMPRVFKNGTRLAFKTGRHKVNTSSAPVG